MDNSWFVNVIKGLVPSGRLSHWKGDSDTIYGNVLIPDTIREEEDSDYRGMFSVGNCEIGIRSISTCPSVFRAICMNGCIWDQEMGVAIRKVHRGEINLEELKDAIKLNLEEQIPLLPEGIERLLAIRAKGTDGASLSTVFASVAKDHKLSKKQATAANWPSGDMGGSQPDSGGPSTAPSGETSSSGTSALKPHARPMTRSRSGQVGAGDGSGVMSNRSPLMAMTATEVSASGRKATASSMSLSSATSLVLPHPASAIMDAPRNRTFR